MEGQFEVGMGQVNTSRLQQALEVVETLPTEDQETLIELVRRRLAEPRRIEIAGNAAATLRAVREGQASYGSVDDLKRDLLARP